VGGLHSGSLGIAVAIARPPYEFVMRAFFTLAFFAVLIVCTLFAVRTWWSAKRGAREMEPAERQLFRRFIAGLAIFWLIAVAGFFGGFISL